MTARSLHRTMSWRPILVATAVAGATLVISRWVDGDTTRACLTSLGVASLVAPLTAGASLEDEAWDLTAASPRTLLARRTARIALVLLALAASWALLLGSASVLYPRSIEHVDAVGWSARAAGLAMAAIAVAAIYGRSRRDHLGLVAAAVIVVIGLVAVQSGAVSPESVSVPPWLGVTFGAAGLVVFASREPLPR